MSFKVIETQEEFDEAIKERIARAKESVRSEYEGFLSPEQVKEEYKNFLSPEQVEERYKGFLSPEEASKKDEVIKAYETASTKTRIALDYGLPYTLATRLSGDTEEEIAKDAEALSDLIRQQKGAPPLKTNDVDIDVQKVAMKTMLSKLRGE